MLGGRVPIFVSPNLDQKATVLLLVQGSGAVRPGIWARALCINDKQVQLHATTSASKRKYFATGLALGQHAAVS